MAAVVKTKQSNHYTFSILDSGELVIDHKIATDHIHMTAMEARSLRNLLNKSDVRSTIGAPIKAQKKKNQSLSGPELLVYYEDAASIDPSFAVPTDADLAELFQHHYRVVPESALAAPTYTDNFDYFKGIGPEDIIA